MRGRLAFRPWDGRLSLRLDVRAVVVFVVLGLAAFAGVVANVGVGEYQIPPLDVVRALFGIESDDANYGFIVNVLRLPRALVAVLVGAALALAGAILQGLTRNGLVAPDIVGINAGVGRRRGRGVCRQAAGRATPAPRAARLPHDRVSWGLGDRADQEHLLPVLQDRDRHLLLLPPQDRRGRAQQLSEAAEEPREGGGP
jgi:hypothetical protein